MAQTILRLPEVRARTGLSRSTIYLKVSERSFPGPISLGARSVGWVESEIDAWIAQRIEESRTRGSRRGPPARAAMLGATLGATVPRRIART